MSKPVLVKIDSLTPYEKNSRIHSESQIEQLANSIVQFGFVGAIVIRDGIIAKGHGCISAIKQLIDAGVRIYPAPGKAAGAKPYPIGKIPTLDATGWSDQQFKAYVIADNKLALNADWDMDILRIELEDLRLDNFDLDPIGFNALELADIFASGNEGKTDEDDVPDPPERAKSKLGDVWTLNDHRVMCGNSLETQSVEILLNGNRSDITFTSPPYNVGLSALDTQTLHGKKEDRTAKYKNNPDDLSKDDYKEFLNTFTKIALTHSDYVFSNIQSLAGNKIPLIEHLYEMRGNYADTIIWNKKTAAPAMAHRVLNSQFEYVHIFSNQAKRTIGTRHFRGTVFNVIDINSRQDKGLASVHRATFPVEFAQHFVSNFTETSCYDPFGGTGTTLIACEKTNRSCYMMELDPIYIDVIVKRWQDFTGDEAVNEKTGTSFNKTRTRKK